jgi:arginase
MTDSPVPQCFTASRINVTSAPPNKFRTASDDVTFIWGESCCGQKKSGPQTAPAMVCTDEFQEVIRDLGWNTAVKRVPQIFKKTPEDQESACYQPFCVAATCDAVMAAVNEVAETGAFPVLIGGDHCLSMGSVRASAARYPDLCVVWFDAHADINTIETSPSGNMHGMPIAALLGLPAMLKAPGFADGRFNCVKPENVGYIGLRDVDDGEKETIKALDMQSAFYMEDLQRDGMRVQINKLLDIINPDRTRPIHVSFDVDGLDPIDAPATGTAVPNGVRLHEAILMMEVIRETGCLVSMDVVEVNPSLGNEFDVDITVRNARWVMAHALGRAPKQQQQQQQE